MDLCMSGDQRPTATDPPNSPLPRSETSTPSPERPSLRERLDRLTIRTYDPVEYEGSRGPATSSRTASLRSSEQERIRRVPVPTPRRRPTSADVQWREQ